MAQDTARQAPVDYAALAAEFGTPFYLYDMDAALAALRQLTQSLPASVDVLFAMKANPTLKVLELFRPAVAGLDISSGGELALAQQAGYAPAAMSFAGPGKTDAELRAALEQGFGC